MSGHFCRMRTQQPPLIPLKASAPIHQNNLNHFLSLMLLSRISSFTQVGFTQVWLKSSYFFVFCSWFFTLNVLLKYSVINICSVLLIQTQNLLVLRFWCPEQIITVFKPVAMFQEFVCYTVWIVNAVVSRLQEESYFCFLFVLLKIIT